MGHETTDSVSAHYNLRLDGTSFLCSRAWTPEPGAQESQVVILDLMCLIFGHGGRPHHQGTPNPLERSDADGAQ